MVKKIFSKQVILRGKFKNRSKYLNKEITNTIFANLGISRNFLIKQKI